MIRVCKRCGKKFDPASSDTYYCDECRLEIKRESVLKIAKCSECGIEFIGGIASKYCPDCRRNKANEASAKSKKNKNRRKIGSLDYCKRCSAEYTVKSGKQKYCSECAEIVLAEHNREVSKRKYHENNLYEKQAEQKKALKQDSTICPACCKPFTPNRNNQMYCSSECRKIGGKKNRPIEKSGIYAKKTDSKRYAEPKLNNKTGIRGVYWDNRLSRYVVKIKIGDQFKRLGSFKSLEDAQEAITKAKADRPQVRRKEIEMEKVIYTWYNFMNGARVSACTLNHNPKNKIDHTCECGLKITISVPDGYHLTENDYGDAILVKVDETKGILLQYNNDLNRIEEGGYTVTGNPIKGVRIISKEEF